MATKCYQKILSRPRPSSGMSVSLRYRVIPLDQAATRPKDGILPTLPTVLGPALMTGFPLKYSKFAIPLTHPQAITLASA
ncbi:hypothetical protein RJZ90_002572 [Blastomyces dermatitidis]